MHKRYASETGTCYGCAACEMTTAKFSNWIREGIYDHDAYDRAMAEFKALGFWRRLFTQAHEPYLSDFENERTTEVKEYPVAYCNRGGARNSRKVYYELGPEDEVDAFDYPHQCLDYFPDHLTQGE